MAKYENISLNPETANKFKKFCKDHGRKYSPMLDHMLDFFIATEQDPATTKIVEDPIARLIKKRFNDVIAILKSIERDNLKPTKGKIDAMFQELSSSEAIDTNVEDEVTFVERDFKE